MRKASIRRGVALAGALVLLSPLAVHAEPPLVPASDAAAWPSVDTVELGARRGGLIVQSAATRAAVAGNRVGDDVVTGEVSVSGGSFSGGRGIASNILNTGNNVSIQSTLHVVIELH